jgi:arylformamidase
MELFDISVPLREGMVIYPGDPEVRMERVDSIAAGDPANLTRLDFGVHSGTHVDAPAHFIDGGVAADTLPLDLFLGPCEVVDATGVNGEIGPESLSALAPGAERILFKTRNSELWARDSFVEDFVTLGTQAARELIDRGVRLVGVDYLSVGDPDTHRSLLGAGVIAIEGLDLRGVAPGSYRLACLPLRIVGSDGAPARAVLIRD